MNRYNLTEEQLKDNEAAVAAWLRGEPVERCPRSSRCGWSEKTNPTWDFDVSLYRPKAVPAPIPWSKPEHVPGPVCWLQDEGAERLIIKVCASGVWIVINDASFLSWSALTNVLHSTDRKTWQPCTVEEGK